MYADPLRRSVALYDATASVVAISASEANRAAAVHPIALDADVIAEAPHFSTALLLESPDTAIAPGSLGGEYPPPARPSNGGGQRRNQQRHERDSRTTTPPQAKPRQDAPSSSEPKTLPADARRTSPFDHRKPRPAEKHWWEYAPQRVGHGRPAAGVGEPRHTACTAALGPPDAKALHFGTDSAHFPWLAAGTIRTYVRHSGWDDRPGAGASPRGSPARAAVLFEQEARIKQRVTQIVREADDEGDWQAAGCSSSAQWLAQVSRSDHRTAARITRTSAALRSLPALDHALSTGAFTLDQVAAAAEFATPGTDAEVARLAVGKPPSAIALAARTRWAAMSTRS